MQHLLEIKENKQKTEKLLSYPILCPLWHLQQRKQIIMKFVQFGIYFNVADLSAYRQRRTASTKRGHLIAQVKNTSVKWSIKPCIVRTKKIRKALIKETVDWIMKNSNVRESPITRDTLLITDADTKEKRKVP